MTPEQWRRVKAVLATALEKQAEERRAYLEEACAGDDALRSEVESLIAAESAETSFDKPSARAPSLSPGRRFGSYEIVASLGGGGMGEVYRAHDDRLGRDVALKLLPEGLAQDPDALERFRREARVLAALSHPNIAALHGLEEVDGASALELELVEGETLRARIRRGPIPLREALTIAREIALGLEAAHAKEIVHRDLKPENVKLTPEGAVKLLDFGLAKVFRDDKTARQLTPPSSSFFLGTAAYTSPEQALGQSVDARTDIWAFGVVLWEMLSGRRPFTGETVADTLTAVLKAELAWDALPSSTPSHVRRLLARCLERDPRSRLHDIADGRLELQDALREASAARPERHPLRAWRVWLAAAGAGLSGAIAIWTVRPEPPPLRPLRHLTIPEAGSMGYPAAISPDGRRVVYTKSAEPYGQQPLHVRSLDDPTPRELSGTNGARNPFFSPNGEWVAFFQGRALWRTEACARNQTACGGTPQKICDADGEGTGFWSGDDAIVLSQAFVAGRLWPGLARVPARGGQPRLLTTVDPAKGERFHSSPEVLPDQRTILFTVETRRGYAVEAATIDGGRRRRILEDASTPRYAPSGHLVFYRQRSRSLLAVAFDAARVEVRGSPHTVATGVMSGSQGLAGYAISREGTLVYDDVIDDVWRHDLVWVTRDGAMKPLLVDGERRAWIQPRLSPDGRRLLVRQADTPNCHLWMYDLTRGTLSRLTTEGDTHDPTWSPDGRRIAYSAMSDGALYGIQLQDTEGTGQSELVALGPERRGAPSWSMDGTRLAYTISSPSSGLDIWVLSTPGGQEKAFLATEFDEDEPAFSPDGRWLAYSSDESGALEVYVRSFPGGSGKLQISSNGGSSPSWSADGRELFFESKSRLMTARFNSESTPHAAPAQVLFEGNFFWERESNYHVARDGSRFVMVKPSPRDTRRALHVVLDWFDELRRRVPVG